MPNEEPKLKKVSIVKIFGGTIIGGLVLTLIFQEFIEFNSLFYEYGVILLLTISYGTYSYLEWREAKRYNQKLYDRLDDDIDHNEYYSIGHGSLKDLVIPKANVSETVEELESHYFETELDNENDLLTYHLSQSDQPFQHSNQVFVELMEYMHESNWMKVKPNPNHSFFEQRVQSKLPFDGHIFQFNSVFYIFIDHQTVDLSGFEDQCEIAIYGVIKLPDEHAHILIDPRKEPFKTNLDTNHFGLPVMKNYTLNTIKAFDNRAYPPSDIFVLLDHMNLKQVEFYEDNLILSQPNQDPVADIHFLKKFMPKIRSLYPEI